MEEFCGGEALWNTSLTWGNDRTYPGFTECFQNTILVWVPSGWLVLASLIYLPYLLYQPSNLLPRNKKNWLKLVLAVLQVLVLIVELSHVASKLNSKQETYWRADVVGPLIEGITMVLVAVYIELERRKGIITSGVLCVYWVIASVAYVIPFYLRLIEKEYQTFLLGFVMSNIYFLMCLTQLVLSCLAEEVPVTTRKKPCPETRASFFSRLFFQWIQSLVVTGYRKPLAEDDMFSLKVEDQSKTLIVPFERNWLKEEAKLQIRKGINTRTHDTTFSIQFEPVASESYNEFSERTPLLKNHSKKNPQSESSDEKTKKEGVSLNKVLFKTFGFELFRSNLPKLFYDVLVFVNPFLLRQLIDFTEDSTQPSWKGYVYSAGFFAVSVLQGLLMHNMIHHSMTLGIKLRSTLISAIFKKSLRLSNQARTESTAGEIVNLMSVDAQNIEDLCEYMWCLWSGPLQIIVCVILLYYTVGFAMFAGLGVMLLLTPINLITTSKVQTYQKSMMEYKDSRIKLMTEILNGIKILKLYAWEMAFGEKITAIRGKELAMMYKEQMMYSISTLSWTVAPFTVGLATFATYIFTKEDHRFDPQSVFVAIVLFNILRFAMNVAPLLFMELVMCWVSVARIQAYLNKADIDTSNVTHFSEKHAVSITDGTFLWDKDIGPALRRINLQIPKGSLVAIVGSVGSGKSSLVSAMLGEMEKVGGTVNVDGSTAYVAQQAWIQNASVKNNILFGNDFLESRYNEVVEACALKADIDMLPAGDLTEIGEKGINLSGGQKQRVSLARAVFFDSDIYLLDDPLSAVDTHVGKHIFEHVIGKTGLLKNKTRILVTHGIHWLPHVDTIVVVTNGEISETGSYEALLSHDGAFSKFLKMYLIEHEEELEAADSEDEEDVDFKKDIFHRLVSVQSKGNHSEANALTDTLLRKRKSHRESDKSTRGDKMIQYSAQTSPVPSENIDGARLIEDEEVEVGRVQWKVYMQYARALGLKYVVCLVVVYAIYQSLYIWSAIWLANWTADPQLQNLTLYPANSPARRELNNYYLSIYGEFGIAQAIAVLVYSLVNAFCVIQAAKVLHQKLLVNVLRGPMSFFDTTPVGRIVNRFSQDIEAVDSTLPEMIAEVMWSFFTVISIFVVVAYSTPIFLTVILPLGFLYFIMQRFFIPTSRQLKRLETKTRSPIYNNFGETLAGVTTIRAFCVQERFMDISYSRVDLNQEYTFASNTVERWLGIRLDIMGGVVVLAASLFSVLERGKISSAIVGLSVSYALQITEILAWFVRMVSEFETNIVSVERIGQYAANKTEAPLHSDVQLPVDWPSEGRMELRSYCTRYRDGLPLVLQNLHLKFEPGEKVGIVGRTGAGKSSLTLALFRLIEAAEGSIVIDGEDISRLGLHDLRSRLTILPQEPILFSGSLRMNLDPLGAHDDDALWASLEHSHLKTFIEGLPSQLEYEVGESGQNLSVGQRQLICLARSLLRKTKILVLDEATAAVDLETDSLIQNTISSEFRDCTVLTIAHRLNTVMEYDKILVLSDGRILEYDRPETLLGDSNSAFYAMAKDAGLV